MRKNKIIIRHSDRVKKIATKTYKKGILYYNSGIKCLVRLLVSIHSLRKINPKDSITILFSGDDCENICKKISQVYNIDLKKVEYNVPEGYNRILLEKCLCYSKSPYDINIFLDADTLILKDFSKDLWEYAEKYEFAVPKFSNWKSNGKRIYKRIIQWKNIYPDLIDDAINFGPAINSGVFSFKKNSSFIVDWYNLAILGRNNFIADETCCQLFLHKYPHIILDSKYNVSCRYDNVYKHDNRIIHYHGRKHCKINKEYKLEHGAELWIKEYDEVISNNVADILSWQPSHDRTLRKYIKYKKQKGNK